MTEPISEETGEEKEIEFDKHPLELVAELIWNGDDEGSYYEAVKDMARTLCDMPISEDSGAQEFFTRFLHEHVLEGFGLKDETTSNAWGLQAALLARTTRERVK